MEENLNQPQQPDLQETIKTNEKKIRDHLSPSAVFLFAIIVVIIAIGLSATFLSTFNKNSDREESFNTAPNYTISSVVFPKKDLSDWNTYRSAEYGFEMKYPSNYVLVEHVVTEHNPMFISLFKDSITESVDCCGIKVFANRFGEGRDANFEDHKNRTIYEFEQWVGLELLKQPAYKNSYLFAKVDIDGEPGLIHKREFWGWIGNIYDLNVITPNGDLLEFSSEDNHEILDGIYQSLRFP